MSNETDEAVTILGSIELTDFVVTMWRGDVSGKVVLSFREMFSAMAVAIPLSGPDDLDDLALFLDVVLDPPDASDIGDFDNDNDDISEDGPCPRPLLLH